MAMLALAGCGDLAISSQPGAAGGSDTASAFAQFTDIPLPGGNSIDMDRTLVLGGETGWTGRLALTSQSRVSEMYDFFRREMPKFGWSEVTSARSGTSFLTYQRDSRIATVQISPSRLLLGSAIDITVAPRVGQSPQGQSQGFSQPEPTPTMAPSPARRGVDIQPAPRR